MESGSLCFPNNVVLDVMKRILQNDDMKEGFWYPSQYYEALVKTGKNQKRIVWFRNRGDFFHGYLPHNFFLHTTEGNRAHQRSPTGKITDFKVKPSIVPSEAMDALFTQITLIDCANACQIAQYQAIREAIGDAKFNQLFEGKIRIGDYENPEHPLNLFLVSCHEASHPLTRGVVSLEDNAVGTRVLKRELTQIPVGARVIFTNVDRYTQKHMMGLAASFNAIKAGDDRYYAFRISKEVVTGEEICNFLINAFNKDRVSADHLNNKAAAWYKTRSRHYAEAASDKVVDFQQEGGGFYPFAGKVLNEALINKIDEMPLNEVSWRAIVALEQTLYHG